MQVWRTANPTTVASRSSGCSVPTGAATQQPQPQAERSAPPAPPPQRPAPQRMDTGQRAPCETLFGEAQQLYERLPARAPCRFTKDTGIHASYAVTAYPASAYLQLRDFETARKHGEVALAALGSAPPGSRSPYGQAQTQLVLATSLVGLGTPDDAVALRSQTLTATRMVAPLVAHARALERAPMSRYPKLACVREFHEQYQHVTQRSTAAQGES